MSVDVVIIGAGVAGLAAAKAARPAGLTTRVIEAKPRIGGRAYTETASLRGIPFDHGAMWLHSASENPLVAVADRLGFSYRKTRRGRRIRLATRWASAAERRDWLAFETAGLRAIEAAARAGRDMAISDAIPRDSRWTSLFDRWVTVFAGVDPDAGSTLDYVRYRDLDQDWPVRDGFGALIAAWGQDVEVALKTPARSIERTRDGVRVTTARGAIDARVAIVTVSTAVLGAEAIRFDPPLPDWKRAAIAAVPMGPVNKVAILFDRDVFGMPAQSSASFVAPYPDIFGFQIRPFGRNLATAHLGGRFAIEMERAGEAAIVALALDRLQAMFGSSIARRVVAGVATAWASDPFIGGGYSAALPGRAHLRSDLARPVHERIFFAGEATHPHFFSAAHGAYLSGAAAVAALPRGLGR